MPEKNILIADDDQVILDMLKEMIQREGYRVFLTSNGKEAVEAVKINPIDLAILDIKMPVMDGIEALEEIKKIDQGIEVLIMTGYADLETLTQAVSDYGAFDYILKPFKRADILNGIKNALLKQDFASQKKVREKEPEERILQLEKEFHERTHQLRESQIKYKDIVENSNDAIVVIQDEKLKFANTKTVELTGYPQEELKDMSFLEMVHPEDRNMVEEIYKSEDFPSIFSFRALRKNGESLWVEINAMRTMYEGRPAIMVNIRDITERKQAEEALRESEVKYHNLYDMMRLITDNVPDLIWAKDMDDKFVLVNQAMCDKLIMCGSPDNAIGKTDMFFAERERNAGYEHTFGEICVNSDAITKRRMSPGRFLEDGLVRNRYFVLDVHKAPFLSEHGEMIGTVGCGREITKEKETEKALRENEEKYRSLVESTEDSIYLLDRDCKYLFMNKKHLSRLSLAPKKAKGKTYAEFHSEDDTKDLIEKAVKVFKTGNSLSYEYKSERDDEYYIRTLSPVKEPDGRTVSITVVSKDITERKQAEEALRESEQKFRNLADSSPSMIFVYQAGKVVYANQICQDLMGYTIEEFLSPDFDFLSLIAPESVELIKDNLSKHMQEKEISPYEYVLLTKDGERLNAIMTSRLIDYQGESAILGIITDITDRKLAEEDLRRSNEEVLREHNQRKMLSKRLIDLLEKDRRQISMELHDHIGQILTSLKMNLEVIHGKLKPGHTDLEAQITAAQEKVIQAIKDVKNVSHGLRPAMIDALGVVSSLRELFNEIEQQTDMEIHFFSRGIPKRFEEEKELAIYRIAQDALTNIIRHARAKNVFVNLVKKDEKLSLSVEDDGAGFDYHKAMQASGSKGPLGLLIMRERAVQLDGEFTLESQPGKGTHLLVEIPI